MSEKRLPFLIMILPVMSLLLSMFIFIATYINQQKKIIHENLHYIKILYMNHAISAEKNKIRATFEVLVNNYEHINEIVKPKLKSRVDMAYSIIMNIYKKNKNMPKSKLIRIIRNAVAPIRFDDGEGYFFIYNTSGVNILLPPDKSVEGKNMLNIKDIHGEYVVKKAIKIAKNKKEGYLEWYWYKPINYNITMKSKILKKVGYIKYIKPLDWLIGTGIYLKSEFGRMENNFLKFYETEKRRANEYFMVLKPIGKNRIKILADSNNPSLSGKIVKKTFKDVNGYSYLLSVFNLIGKGKTEGAIKYGYCKKNNSGKEIIIYMFYKKLNMLVLSGFDLNSIEDMVLQAQKQYKNRLYKYVRDYILFSFVIILVVGMLFLLVSYEVNKVFFKYKKEVEDKEEKLKKLALYDNLTQVYNRNKFNEILKYELNMSKRYKLPLSLVMFDLDRFKKINDKFGHQTGDKVLKTIATKVQASIRLTDTLARWGGEEFLIILTKTDVNKAKNIAETLRIKIENIDFKEIGRVTCSLGVTGMKEDDNEETLIKRVDKAMYKAKENGRNRVEIL